MRHVRPPRAGGVRSVAAFVTPREHATVLDWLQTLHPLWEMRFSTVRPIPAGETQRWLQRPVYWLGNWQFACLGYYHPPRGIHDRCVRAEPFPDVLQQWVGRIEDLARRTFPPAWIPPGWAMDTCLINFYGNQLVDGKTEDRARVGAHRDFEPGPVASVSLGARALFQFTTGRGDLVEQTWLDDRQLLLFAGPTHKDRLFHRVQRVERNKTIRLPPAIDGFVTRRINFTFRHVPPEHVKALDALDRSAQADVREYVERLAAHSHHWASALRSTEG